MPCGVSWEPKINQNMAMERVEGHEGTERSMNVWRRCALCEDCQMQRPRRNVLGKVVLDTKNVA